MSNLVLRKFSLRPHTQTFWRIIPRQTGFLFERQRVSLFSTINKGPARNSSSTIRWFWIPPGVGFGFICFLQLRRILERERRETVEQDVVDSSVEKSISPWQINLFKAVPTKVLSRLWGRVNDVELPVSLRSSIIRLWIWAFECRVEEADEQDISKYPNLGAFFTRKLKPGARIIDEESELVCPVDGRVLHFGHLIDEKLEQVKGVSYSLEEFVGPKSTFLRPKTEKTCLFHCVLYLGPGDCHHFHSPTEWSIQARRHFSGDLYSVSPWVLKGFKDVFTANERVTLFGNWKHGLFTMTAVGAYNVGSIAVHFDEELLTNKRKAKKGRFEDKQFVQENVALSRGDPVGCFAMGSAIVLIFEAPKDFQFCVEAGQKVMMGQPLGSIPKKS